MPRINFPTIGDIEDYEFLQGTIKTIDSSTDTCTVEVDGSIVPALLYYHCLPDSQLRENGAIQGSAAGFAVDDSVIVQLKYDRSVVRVVAHVDGVRSCGWSFRLVRADGDIADSTWYAVDIQIYNSAQQWIGSCQLYRWSLSYPGEEDQIAVNGETTDGSGNPWTIAQVFNAATKEWFFRCPAGTEDPNGYYVAATIKKTTSSNEVGVTTFNDGEYSYSRRWDGPLMQTGKYNYLVHYFQQELTVEGCPAGYNHISNFALLTPAGMKAVLEASDGHTIPDGYYVSYLQTSGVVTKRAKVASSIPFSITAGRAANAGYAYRIGCYAFAMGGGLCGSACTDPSDVALNCGADAVIAWAGGEVSWGTTVPGSTAETTTTEAFGPTFEAVDPNQKTITPVPPEQAERTATMTLTPGNLTAALVCLPESGPSVNYEVTGTFSHFWTGRSRPPASWIIMQLTPDRY